MASIASSLAPPGSSALTFEKFPEAPPQPDSISTQGSAAIENSVDQPAVDGDIAMGEAVEGKQEDKGSGIEEEKETVEQVQELPGYGDKDQDDDAGSLQDAEGEDDDTFMTEGSGVGGGGEGTSAFPETRRGPSRPSRPPQTTQIELSDETELGKIEKPKRRRSTSVKKQGEDEDDDFDPTGDDTKEAEASSQEEPSDYDEAESARPKKKPKPKVEKPHGRWGRPPGPDAVPLVKAENPRDPAKVWECIIGECKKAFVRKNDLQRHIKSHNDTREFQCSFENCNKAFLQRSALHVHERVHTGEQPYACETCERRFADTSSLARHRRIHTGVRPYKCEAPDCGRDFCRKITLQNHISTQHPPDGVPPPRKKRAKKSDSVEAAAEGSEAPVKAKRPRKKKEVNQEPVDPSLELVPAPPAPKPKRVRKPKAPKDDASPPPPSSTSAVPTRTVPQRARALPPRYADSPPPSSHVSSFAQPSSAPPSEPQQAPIAWSLPLPRSFKRVQPDVPSPASPHRPSTPIVENRQSLYHLPESVQPVDTGLNQQVEEELEQLYQFACAEESAEEPSNLRCGSVPPSSIPHQPISVRSTLSEPPQSPRPFFASLDKPAQAHNGPVVNGDASTSAINGALEEEEDEEDLYA